jgi:hypothetical protein
MSFSPKQIQALRRQPNRCHIRTRQAHGRELSYLEGWYAISEANRIFGFDGWSRETLETRCVLARETRGTFLAVYLARVRVTVQADGLTIIREGHGTGEGRGTSPGEVHDVANRSGSSSIEVARSPLGSLCLRRPSRCPRIPAPVFIPMTLRLFHAHRAITAGGKIS